MTFNRRFIKVIPSVAAMNVRTAIIFTHLPRYILAAAPPAQAAAMTTDAISPEYKPTRKTLRSYGVDMLIGLKDGELKDGSGQPSLKGRTVSRGPSCPSRILQYPESVSHRQRDIEVDRR